MKKPTRKQIEDANIRAMEDDPIGTSLANGGGYLKLTDEEQVMFEDMRKRPDVKRSTDTEMRDEINEHRRATGHPAVKFATDRATLLQHLAKINVHAPYGNDPWAED